MKKHSNSTTQTYCIIIIDDDAAVRNSLKFSFEVEGYVVHTYEHAEELLSKPVFPACRCLVIDQNLPGSSGIDLIAKLRKREVSVPAIVITTHPSQALKRRATIENVSIIEKPLLSSDLLDSINQVVKRPMSNSN